MSLERRVRVKLNVEKARQANVFSHKKAYLLRDAGTIIGWDRVDVGLVKVKWDKLKRPELIWAGFLSLLEEEKEAHRGDR